MRNSLHLEFRNKMTGKVDPKIYRVVGDVVTLNPRFKFKQYFQGDSSTIFKEIEIVNYREVVSPEILMASSTPRSVAMSENMFFDGLVETLRKFIEENWSRHKHHLVQHSSGWDSRIMASIIRRIYEERGDGWLGDVSFVAWGHEAELAAKIVEAEGWNPDLFTPVLKDMDYFGYGFDFWDAWRGLNGVTGYPVNNPDWAFHMLRRRDVVPDETQVWSASWFNETFGVITRPHRPSFERAFINFYYNCVNAQYGAAFDFEFVQPLFNAESVEHLVKAQVQLRGTPGEIRRRLVQRIDKKLGAFPRLDHKNIKVPPRRFEQIKRDYKNSWYGTSHPIDPRRTTREVRYADWWASWSAASLCEHLLETGVEIKT